MIYDITLSKEEICMAIAGWLSEKGYELKSTLFNFDKDDHTQSATLSVTCRVDPPQRRS